MWIFLQFLFGELKLRHSLYKWVWAAGYISNRRHYSDVIMCAMGSQITSLAIVYSIVYSGADQRKHQSSASLACVRGIHRWHVNSPYKWPVTRQIFPFDGVIMETFAWGNIKVTVLDSTHYTVFWNTATTHRDQWVKLIKHTQMQIRT